MSRYDLFMTLYYPLSTFVKYWAAAGSCFTKLRVDEFGKFIGSVALMTCLLPA